MWWSSKAVPSTQPLRGWLTQRFAWVAALPLVAVAALLWLVLWPRLSADIDLRHRTLARVVAGQVETYLLGARRQLDAVADLVSGLGYRPTPYWFQLLDAHVGTGTVFEAIYLVNAVDLVHSVGLPVTQRGRREDLLGLDLSRRDFLHQARTRDEAVWSELFLSAITGRLAVALAIPAAGQMVVVGEIAVEPLSDLANNLPENSELLALLLDRQGQKIVHSRSGSGGQQINLSHLPIVSNALRGDFATHNFRLEGETLTGTVVGVAQVGWTVLVAQPQREAFRQLAVTLWMMGVGLGVALLLAASAGWALARDFSRRFARYTEQARAIANGEYDRTWPISHIAEFADLADHLRHMALAIHQREERQRLATAVFEAAREAILVTDAYRNIVAVNPAFTVLSGYTEAEALGRNPSFLKSGRHSAAYYAALWRTVAQEGAWQGEFWNRRKDGELYIALATLSEVRDATGQLTHYVGISTDITHLKEAEQRIERLAYYDALTDLPNRTLLTQRAELALALAARRNETLAVMFLDLDRFKEVNDSLGHAEGDALLVQVATRLQTLTRVTDTVCRLGGDEFVLLLPDVGQDGALQVADKILAAFRQPFAVAGHQLRVTVSMGIALYPTDGQDFGALLKNADAALYRAKQDGRNTRAFYAPELNVAAYERLVLESELRQALECGQLVAYFQPKVRLRDEALVGAEALVRWRHPERGLIPPGQFIPVAEASDLIVDLGEWMLEEVCRQLAVWRTQGHPPLTVAVNLAARHFHDPRLVDRVRERLALHGLPPRVLEMEITESTLLEVGARTADTLQALHQFGIGLAIDDFGTGYSSLSYLKRLPVTALKIDRSFVRDLETDPENRALAATIVALGHNLGLQVVAEGVETEEQRRILLEQGCDLAQGYYFGRPVPAEAFVVNLLKIINI